MRLESLRLLLRRPIDLVVDIVCLTLSMVSMVPMVLVMLLLTIIVIRIAANGLLLRLWAGP